MIVIDASAMIEALLKPAQFPLEILTDDLHAPHLLDLEVTSALRGLNIGGQLEPERADEALGDYFDLNIQRWRAEPLVGRVWSLRHQYTAYDAKYLALAEALDVPRPDGGAEELSWGGGTGLGGNTFDTGTSVSFHDFGGPVAFLRRYARLTGRLAPDAEAAVRGWRRRASLMEPVLAEMPWSVLAGRASVPVVLGSGAAPIAPQGDVGDAHPNARAVDITHGSAGLVAMLAADPATQATDETLREHAERVAAALADGDQVDTDLLHGRLGLAWALLRTGRRLGRADWVERATRSVRRSADAVGPTTPRGWCNGAAGVALVAAEAGLPTDTVERLVAAATAVVPDGSVDLSVCHGEAGIAQVVSWIDRRAGRSPARARAHLDRVLDRAWTHGFHNGSHGHTALVGYLLGWSGVADTLLLASDELGLLSHPVALEVDPPLTSDANPTPIESRYLVSTSGPAA